MLAGELGYAGPFAPSLAPLTTAFGLLLLCIVLWGLREGYMHTLGALLYEIADVLRRAPLVGGRLAGALDGINDRVQAALAHAQAAAQRGAALAWNAFTEVIEYAAETILDMNAATLSALIAVRDVAIPRAVGGEVKPLRRELADFRTGLRRVVDQELARFRHGIDRLRRDLAAEHRAAFQGIDALGSSLAARLRSLEGRLNARIEAAVGALRRPFSLRLSRLERLLAAGVLGGIAVAALTRVFPFWQCTNVRRFNRGLCRTPTGWLDLLFGVGVEAILVSQLCDFVYALSIAARGAQPLLIEFVAVEDVLIGCHGATKPPALPVAARALPRSHAPLALGA
jgi:hypothetical protein